jgi:Tfp pilus tip-associated adhesin PilY1
VVPADDPLTPEDERVATCTERTWRTLLLGSYREGGPGIFALDITQPDVFDSGNQPRPLSADPAYVPSCIDGGVGCDEFCAASDTACANLPFPALKWEFRDLDANAAGPADDDGNGAADLAESWSRPLVFRLPVCDGECDTDGEPEDRWVAAFGGGLSESPSNDSGETTGNWIYLLDVETGRVLYKRGGTGVGASGAIVGSVPSDITGVDFDVDGYVDTLYFGTTAGYVYKVSLGDGPGARRADRPARGPRARRGAVRPVPDLLDRRPARSTWR